MHLYTSSLAGDCWKVNGSNSKKRKRLVLPTCGRNMLGITESEVEAAKMGLTRASLQQVMNDLHKMLQLG